MPYARPARASRYRQRSGRAVIPNDAVNATEALRVADIAMYAQKNSERTTAGRQSTDVLLSALTEHHPNLGDHLNGVTELVQAVGRQLDIGGEELSQLGDGAALHDIGKIAIPDSIINKPSALNDDEWALVRRHTLIGERIVSSAPALRGAARIREVLSREHSMEAGTQTASPATRSHSAPASSPSVTPSTR